MAIARALVSDPQLVLADEPTGNLDSQATVEVLRLFEDLHASGQTLVVVTHDSRIAATADRLISMRDGAFVDETRLTGGSSGDLGALAGLSGLCEREGMRSWARSGSSAAWSAGTCAAGRARRCCWCWRSPPPPPR